MKEAVYFVGAGPGDKDLITVKGMKVLQEADVIIYAGSLVSPELLDWTKEGAQIYNSAGLNLNEVLTIIKEGVAQGKKVVRLHTGDPTIYGAIREQIDNLEQEGIECRVIPGVSSFTASAGAINKEVTLPAVGPTGLL
ncbi:MAG TPA: cobalt-precorrin-4 C(11)-methyltransferase, partial [Eubacteriaceae bacterium]|nr:cobalt-precorrin-4 C(11)-methyltransferase [Eubacteriaceae bacterium]